MTFTRLAGAVSAAALLAAAPAAIADHHGGGHSQMQSQQTVVDVAVGSPAHTTLVAAVQAAGLVETLSGPGPFTVFAPVNDAFAALPAGTVDTLLQPANRAMLTKVLTYHVVAGRVAAADVIALIEAGNGSAA
ncbi:fasciclin, partial [Brevundimonas sp. AAP58]|uniref:fasciclin domain-containing protein n=1 Tax=Brevundimonas sp. AAP58 TaxID=1523422 RepID=UPI0006B89B32